MADNHTDLLKGTAQRVQFFSVYLCRPFFCVFSLEPINTESRMNKKTTNSRQIYVEMFTARTNKYLDAHSGSPRALSFSFSQLKID